MKPITRFAPIFTLAALLALCACTDDTDNPGNGNDPGTNPANPAACLTPRDISYSPPVLGGASSHALHEDLGTTGTPLPPNALITDFTSGDALTLSYSFSPGTDYPYHATLTRADAGAATPWTLTPQDGSSLRPDADADDREAWSNTRAMLTYEPLTAANLSSGIYAETTPVDGTPTGFYYTADATDSRMYYDRLIATTTAPGTLRIVTDLDSPNLGQFSATLQHAGAMLKLPADKITIGTDFLEGYTADGLTLTATVRPANGNADGTDDYTLGFSRAVGTQQALLPPGATVITFQAVLTKKNLDGSVIASSTFLLSTTALTVAANHRYPMALTLTETKAEVSFSEPTGVPGFEEEEMDSDAIENLDYNEVKEAITGNVTGWTVHTAVGLKAFAKLVNSATSDADAVLKLNCTLTADIDLSRLSKDGTGSNWMPIDSISTPYQGIFDGDGHTVSGLVINRPDADCQGLFGCIGKEGSPATVKNLTVKGTVTGNKYNGGIVGYSSYSIITNCTYEGSVAGNSYTGRIVGYDYRNTITAIPVPSPATNDKTPAPTILRKE